MSIETMAYISVWESADNVTHNLYLPVSIYEQDVAGAVHLAVCGVLGLAQDKWKLDACSMPHPFIYIITFKAVGKSQSVMSYSVKF
jgi:hypothetical protein